VFCIYMSKLVAILIMYLCTYIKWYVCMLTGML